MNDERRHELENLLALRSERELSEAEVERLNQLMRDDAEALDLVLNDLEIEAALQWEFGQVPQPAARPAIATTPKCPRRWAGAIVGLVATACLVLVLAIPDGGPDMEDRLVNDVEEVDEERNSKPGTGWKVTAVGQTKFEYGPKGEIILNKGELQLQRESSQQEVRVVTPHGVVSSTNSQFIVGLCRPENPGGIAVKPFVRVLVLAGMVTLSNSLGTVSAEEGVILKAAENEKPVKIAVRANSAFAWDLYRELAKRDATGNIFVSPFSVSSALAMVGEGARGETAGEFAKVMHLREELQRIGKGSQQLPFQASLYHTGMAQIQKALDQADTPEKLAIRTRLAELRKELAGANLAIQLAETVGLRKNLRDQFKRAHKLADEINKLQTEVDQYRLTIANAVWVDQTFPLRNEYVETLNSFYKTDGAFPVDFIGAPDGARSTINEWVSKKTEKMLPQTLGPNAINPQTRLVLTNAIFFMGQWHEPFKKTRTKAEPFTLANGDTKDVMLMRVYSKQGRYAAFKGDGTLFPTPEKIPVRRGRGNEDPPEVQRYPDKTGFRLIELPYKGERIAMYVIAPEDPAGLSRVESLLSEDRFESWVGAVTDYGYVRVDLPRFSLNADYNLESVLPELGLKRAFQLPVGGRGADLSGITSSQSPNDRLWISRVIHKAKIEVNEEGTKAAAVTAVAVDASAEAPFKMVPFNPQFRADRPFLFVIRDTETGCILFVGRHVQPDCSQAKPAIVTGKSAMTAPSTFDVHILHGE